MVTEAVEQEALQVIGNILNVDSYFSDHSLLQVEDVITGHLFKSYVLPLRITWFLDFVHHSVF